VLEDFIRAIKLWRKFLTLISFGRKFSYMVGDEETLDPLQ